LAGFVPTENMRFRDFELNFKIKEDIADGKDDKKKKEKDMTDKEKADEEAVK
jgi:ATP-binding cassette subfamily E protein 1